MLEKHRKTAKAVNRKYDFLARVYDKIYAKYSRETIGQAITALSIEGWEHILDIGCGTGALEEKLVQQHPRLNVVGIDISSVMLQKSREKLAAYANILLKEGDFLKTPLDENRFDIAYSLSNLHYFIDPLSVLKKTRAHLKKKGHLVLVDWNRKSLKGVVYNTYMRWFDPGFAKVYTIPEAKKLLEEAGFQITDIRRFRVGILWNMMRLTARKI